MFLSHSLKNRLIHGPLLILILMYSGLAWSNNDTAELQRLINQNKQIFGSFTQVIVSQNGTKAESTMGDFWIKSPGKFRWDYTAPYVQNIVSDGTKIWFYDADLEQVTIKKLSTSAEGSPLAIFDGTIPIQDVFTIQRIPSDENLFLVKLTPKGEVASFESIDIGFTDGVLAQMDMHDQFGQTTQLLFTDLFTSSLIEDSIFTFVAPEGIDVFEEQ